MSIERRFDVPLIAGMALREKQIQQSYRPIIGVHKWFARRPGTLFRGLILAEFSENPLKRAFFESNDLEGLRIADPFMGGGTPLIEANRVGCDVEGFDVNPMSAWIVREEMERLDIDAYQRAASSLVTALGTEIDRYYWTDCPLYGDGDVPVKSFLWVKVLDCQACEAQFDLFPGYLLARNRRHPTNVLICPQCGDLNEVDDLKRPGACRTCQATLRRAGPARRSRCECPRCGHTNTYPGDPGQPPEHRLFAIEYYNPERKAEHKGRFFKKPDAADIARMVAATRRLERMSAQFIPEQEIPAGDETARLHRWGYSRYRDMFNRRQLLGLELSCRLIADTKDERVRRALATNLSDLLRYQNMLCRYDTASLKSLDIFSIHGFPVGLIQCESNMLGIVSGNGSNIGSGGWSNIVTKYAKAKRYCEAPYEVRHVGRRKFRVPIEGERIGEGANGTQRRIAIRCGSATEAVLAPNSLDAVFTDPPYFGNVQYAELMDFCYVWLRRLIGKQAEGFAARYTRSANELTANVTQERGIEEFTEGLSEVYSRMARALKPGAPLVFTYHHNSLDAYCAVGVAILDAGLVCSASLPCPAEMGGSIHIHGTNSSIIDTVFVCRTSGETPGDWLFDSPERLLEVVNQDLTALSIAGRKASAGDTRCIILGHLTRIAVWRFRTDWDRSLSTAEKIAALHDGIIRYGKPDELTRLVEPLEPGEPLPLFASTTTGTAQGNQGAVSF